MSAGLYGLAGGANRQQKKFFGKVDGVNREIKELWAVKDGVNRKIFSAYDCRGAIGSYTGMKYSSLGEDGSGKIGVYSYFYNDDPKIYEAYLDFYFDSPVSFTTNTVVLGINPLTVEASGASVQSTRVYFYGDDVQIVNQGDFPESAWQFKPSVGGSASHFALELYCKLSATEGHDSYCSVSWPAGALSICGKQINLVQL